jgi:Family of unknown function (DUF5681)
VTGRNSPPSRPGTGEYEVGYRKPPKDTQFKSGQSGNPSGQKKQLKSGKTLAMEALNERILVTKAGRQRRITIHEAIWRRLVTNALKGDIRSMAFLLKIIEQYNLPADSNTEGRMTIEFVKPPSRPDSKPPR